MGNQPSMVASKISDHPNKCLEVRIDVRRGTPERFFLIPVTPTTMPTPQSPLCVILNEALSAPSAVHWAWPPVSNVETPFTGVADDRLALIEALRGVPSVEQTFAHALPRQGTSRQDKGEGHAAAVELGHMLSFVAVEWPIERGHQPRHRGDRAAPRGRAPDASVFFDFSAEWLESIYKMEGCAVVGYFRQLNLFDFASSQGEHGSSCLPAQVVAPIVSVIDHYLFRSFSYEGRAFMLLEAVSFYCKRFANLSPDHGSCGVENARRAPLPVLMRCRASNLPVVRLFQKLYRMHVDDTPEDQVRAPTAESGQLLLLCSDELTPTPPPVRLTVRAEGELLHVHLDPDLAKCICTKLCMKVSTPWKRDASRAACVVKLDKGLVEPTPTPFDTLIEQCRERWLVENTPFRKRACGSVLSDSEGDIRETPRQWSLPQHVDDRVLAVRTEPLLLRSRMPDWRPREQSLTPSSLSSTGLSSTKRIDPLCFSTPRFSGTALLPLTGNDDDVLSVDADPSWESSATSLEQFVKPTSALCNYPPAPRSGDRPGVHTPHHATTLMLHNPTDDSARTAGPPFLESRSAVKQPQDFHGWGATDMAFLQVGTPIQVNNGDGLWICGYWLEALRQLMLHWFDPTRSDNALLEHYGPIRIRGLAGEERLMTPTSTSGKVYIAVAPHVRVFPLPFLEEESVEVRALFECNWSCSAPQSK
jgi:hypothetical protein